MKQFVLMADLDGTLIRRGQTAISEGVASVLAPLIKNRCLVINSARHPEGVRYAFQGRLPFVPTIALNGAALCEEDWTQLSKVCMFTCAAVKAVLQAVSSHNLVLSIYSAVGWWVTRINADVEHEVVVSGMEPTLLGTMIPTEVLKMTAIGDNDALSGFEKTLTDCSSILAFARSNRRYCEISPAGTNKTGFIVPLLEHLGLTRESVDLHFFGDSYNDIECAAFSDSSYTFHTAPVELRRLAERIFRGETDEELVTALETILSLAKWKKPLFRVD